MKSLNEFLAEFGLELTREDSGGSFDERFCRGISNFSRGLQPNRNDAVEFEGWKAGRAAYKVLSTYRRTALETANQLSLFD